VFSFLEVKPVSDENLECDLKNRFAEEDEIDCGVFNSCFIPLCMLAVLGVIKMIVKSLLKSSPKAS
jgi:hypothetical protein